MDELLYTNVKKIIPRGLRSYWVYVDDDTLSFGGYTIDFRINDVVMWKMRVFVDTTNEAMPTFSRQVVFFSSFLFSDIKSRGLARLVIKNQWLVQCNSCMIEYSCLNDLMCDIERLVSITADISRESSIRVKHDSGLRESKYTIDFDNLVTEPPPSF